MQAYLGDSSLGFIPEFFNFGFDALEFEVSYSRMLKTEFYAAKETSSKRLMVVLHGLGDSAAGYRWLPAEMNLPWMNYLLVNAPDEYYGGFSWYDFQDDPEPGIARSRKLLSDLLDLQRAEGWLTEQTTLFGFSQGCLMSWEMGFHYPHRFAGIVGISGYVHNGQQAILQLSPMAKKQRFLITHGTMDPLIPFVAVKEGVKWLKTAGLDITWKEFYKPHTIAGEEELAVIREFVSKGYELITAKT
jgi:phospholipase/carboxylesterase